RVGLPVREASKELGAGPVRTFLRVSLPLARPGVIVGVLLVYIPLMGDYITATVLGGAQGNMVGQLVASQFQTAQNWALGTAMAVLLMLVIMLTIDRKSTRLNSSHVKISYAVFCLKKKKSEEKIEKQCIRRTSGER